MSKTIACLLVASALCVAPVLASAQDIANTAPYTEEPAQAAPVLTSAQDIPNTAPSTDESAQAAPVFTSAEDIPSTAPFTDESAQAAAVLQSAQDIANTAPSTDESAQTASETTDLANVNQMISKLEDMNGKEVIDQNGGFMGTITGVDDETNLAEVELTNGRTIALMPEMLTDMGNGVVAADLTDGDVVADADQSDSDPELTTIETQ